MSFFQSRKVNKITSTERSFEGVKCHLKIFNSFKFIHLFDLEVTKCAHGPKVL